MGSIDLAVPKLRQGTYFPSWLLEPRRRAERAMVTVIAQAYLAGVSTRRVEGPVQTRGVERDHQAVAGVGEQETLEGKQRGLYAVHRQVPRRWRDVL